MKNFLLFFLLTMTIQNQAQAEIVCLAQTEVGPAKVQIFPSSVEISGAALDAPVIYSSLSDQYDGHMTEMLTAPGLSVSFENWYGCIHNATITANFRSGLGLIQTVTVSQCSGGSTKDAGCGIH